MECKVGSMTGEEDGRRREPQVCVGSRLSHGATIIVHR